jgi:hypothetical protein
MELSGWFVGSMVVEALLGLEVADCCWSVPVSWFLIRFDVVRRVAGENLVALVGL